MSFKRWGAEYGSQGISRNSPSGESIQGGYLGAEEGKPIKRNKMKLYKNVDIKDLESILENGILPISVTGNDNWKEGARANNSKDVVYLFDALNKGDSFVNYGLALIEVEVEALENEMIDNDINKDSYVEYICNEVKPSEILNVYIPNFVDYNDSRVTKVDYFCETYIEGKEGDISFTKLTGELKERFEETAPISTSDFNYLRGVNTNNTMIDTYNWKYLF